jgi:hypothetical protein
MVAGWWLVGVAGALVARRRAIAFPKGVLVSQFLKSLGRQGRSQQRRSRRFGWEVGAIGTRKRKVT